MHTTISTLEGIREFLDQGYGYRRDELVQIEGEAQEFLLRHRLFRSDRTGAVIHPAMLRLAFPSRWKYDILRALDYFRNAGASHDERLQDAIEILLKKQTSDGRWKLPAPDPGAVHIEMEPAGEISRWNTLRALRVLDYFSGW